MGKLIKELQWQQEGMIKALEIVKKDGADALEKEVKMRGFFRLPLSVSQKEWDYTLNYLIENLHNTYKTVALMVLHDVFGYGKDRLGRFEENFAKKTMDATDFDYLGQHYVTLGDYARELKEKFGSKIDIERVEECQRTYKGEELKDMADIREVIKVLNESGFKDAAEFLERKK